MLVSILANVVLSLPTFILYLIYHAAAKELLQKEKDGEFKEETSQDVTNLPFSDAVDKNIKDASDVETQPSTTVGYVEITEKAQEEHFQTTYTELGSSQTDITGTGKKKSIGSAALPEKHKQIMLVIEQEGSPMESPMTESDTGISGISGITGDTGSGSKLSKPNQLDRLDLIFSFHSWLQTVLC